MLELLLNQKLIFGLMGGLGLFLFGMKTMSEGLQKIAGEKLRQILAALTNNRIVGTLVGAAVTALVQSSSATTVMVVGLVNAGLMSLVQATGVVLGANIGTTITAQIIAFKISYLALPAIGVGAGLRLFSKDRKWTYVGEIVLGFGLLFFGMETMKHAFDPIKTSQEFHHFFTLVGDNHLLGVLIGAVMTVVVQSSSATIGVTLALASSGLISFEASMALILGENIGTTVTANLAAIGTNLAARRTAFSHFLFNLIGVCYMLLLFPVFIHFVDKLTPGDADFVIQTQQQAIDFGAAIGDKPFISRHIANSHTLFNVFNVLIFLPMIGVLAKLSTLCLRGKEEELEYQLKFIDNRVLNTPPIALGQAKSETRRMACLAMDMVKETMEFLEDQDLKRVAPLERSENLVDLLQREITDFLVALSQKSISQDTSRQIASMMNMINDLERVGDHCENLWRLGQKQTDLKVTFSDTAREGMANIAGHCQDFLNFVIEAMEREDASLLEKALYFEDRIDILENQLRQGHISRLNTGECSVPQGLIFIDMLHNFEKIGDHTYNIAEAVAGKK